MASQFFVVEPQESKQTIAAYLRIKLSMSWSQVKSLIAQGQIRIGTQVIRDETFRISTGKQIEVRGFPGAKKESAPEAPKVIVPKIAKPKIIAPSKNNPAIADYPPIEIVYQDEHIVVVNKPPGITSMRHPEEAAEFGERGKHYLPETLADILPKLINLPNRRVRAVHRLDRDTTGLLIFAVSSTAEHHLIQQFREHTITRKYYALVRGIPTPGRIETILVKDRGDGRRGTRPTESIERGQKAITYIKRMEIFENFSWVECQLGTGRTHQVRIHLGESGTPICGERVYDRPVHGVPYPDTTGATRPMLHAYHLGLIHPITGSMIEWQLGLPKDMQELLDSWRKQATSASSIN